jgi:ribose 5-phosphate isomerase B
MGGWVIGKGLALEILDTWLTTPFSGEERHQRRIDLIDSQVAR